MGVLSALRRDRRVLDRTREPSSGDYELLDLIPDPALIFDASWRVAAANPRAVELFEAARDVLTGMSVNSLFPSFDVKSLKEMERHGTMVLQGKRASGASFPVEISLRPVKRERERHVIAVLRDITKRVRTELLWGAEQRVLEQIATARPLREVLASLALSIEELSDGLSASIMLLTPDGEELTDQVSVSLPQAFIEAFARIPVTPAATACGAAAFHRKLVISEDLWTDPLWRDYATVAISHGLRACWAAPIIDSTGELIGTLALYSRETGSPTDEDLELISRATHLARMAIVRDLNEQNRKQTENRYRTLSELTSDFAYAFRFDADGTPHVEWVTDAFTRITGYDVAEWETIGAWAGIIHPDDRLAFEQRLPRLERGDEVSSELRILTKWGDVRWVSVYSRPVILEGRLAGVVGAAQDFTTRKEAEDSKTMFLATASHELKTPLTVIQGFAQLMGTDQSPGSELGREAAETIDRRAKELGKILERILLSSRIETGKVQMMIEEVAIDEILADRVGTFASAIHRDVELEINEVPRVRADSNALATVIDHLLDNAVKYSPDGGPIRVRTHADSGLVWVAISDRGIGMTEEQKKRCFEKFWQAESTDVRRFGGTGIGLYIVRSLVEAMGGEVSVESSVEKGSTFTFSLRTVAHQDLNAPSKPNPGLGERNSITEFMRQMGVPQVSRVIQK
ncbi:MAG: sensor histidine kinase [Actinomycetota bacterium]